MKRNFDILAPHYRWMESLSAGRKLQRCRTQFLANVSAVRNVVILGEGNGRFLCEFLRSNTEARITCLDDSVQMIHQARRRMSRFGLPQERVQFLKDNVLDWKAPSSGFDLVVTHFFLDCFRFEELRHVVREITRATSNHARWLLADFRLPDQGWRHLRANLMLKMMYLFFRVVTHLPARELADPDSILRENGFRLTSRRLSEWGLLHSDLWEKTVEPESD